MTGGSLAVVGLGPRSGRLTKCSANIVIEPEASRKARAFMSGSSIFVQASTAGS